MLSGSTVSFPLFSVFQGLGSCCQILPVLSADPVRKELVRRLALERGVAATPVVEYLDFPPLSYTFLSFR